MPIKKKPLSQENVLLPTQRMVEADAADTRLFDDMEQTSSRTVACSGGQGVI